MSQYSTIKSNLGKAFAEPSGILNSATAGEILESGAKKFISHYQAAAPTNAQVIFTWVAPVALTFKAGLADCQAKAGTAATASAALALKKNGGTAFGTCTFAAEGTVGTWAAAAQTEFAAGDVLTITGPATADASLAGIAISMVAYA